MAAPSYQINRSTHTVHRRRYRRRSLLLVIVFLVFASAAAWVGHSLLQLKQTPNKQLIGATYVQHIAGPQTFKSSYFQFSDTSKWVYIPNNSTPTKLSYLLYASGLPAHSFTVYVNQTPLQNDLAVTRVLPVVVKDNNSFTVGNISAPCNSQYLATDLMRIRTISLAGTNMLCVPDSPQFSVMVGQVGGDYNLSLKRSDGETANYIIIYHNLTVDPDPAPFVRVMKTFQAL